MDLDRFRLVIFDADGTLVTTKSQHQFRHGAEDWEPLPGRVELLRRLAAHGKALGVATNQGGVGWGFCQPADMERELLALGATFGIPRSHIRWCFAHPTARLEQYRGTEGGRRKPGALMLYEIMDAAKVEPRATLMVGDRLEDREAAHRAGCGFLLVGDFVPAAEAWLAAKDEADLAARTGAPR